MSSERVSLLDNVKNPFPVHSSSALRGDYAHCAADYTVSQNYAAYSEDEHALWRRLFARQIELLPRYAAPDVIAGVDALNMAEAIPSLERTNELLANRTGWKLVAVPGLIPNDVFFVHLSRRQFPVSIWLRKPDEFDYLVEPDIFHDFFGHVPLLMNPVFADYLQLYGQQGCVAVGVDAIEPMARLYWYLVEFGLIRTDVGLRAFGAGILSSGGETRYSIESDQPRRIAFDLQRVMRTEYRIDTYQSLYFVLDDFEQLFSQTRGDLRPLLRSLRDKEPIALDTVLPSDQIWNASTQSFNRGSLIHA